MGIPAACLAAPSPALCRVPQIHCAAIRERPIISDCILIFVRAPEAGRVKTRLAAEIGDHAALRIYRRLAEHAVAEARGMKGAEIRIHFTPADAEDAVRSWLGDDAIHLPQADADLGGRMAAAFDDAFAAGHDRVVIIGSDLPEMSADLLREAFARLDHHPTVLGPARDGGYYLLGLRMTVPEIFQTIAWSTPDVLRATLDRFAALGITPALLPERADVDVAADLPAGWREWAMEGAAA